MRVDDFGFTWEGDGDYVTFGVVIENPNDAVFIGEFVSVNITFLGADGSVVGSEEETITTALPGKTAVGGVAFLDERATEMEVAIDSDWEEIDFDPGEFVFSNVKTTREEYSTATRGRISSTFEEKQEFVEVVAIWRDADGNIIGGDSDYVDFVNPGQKVSFEVESLDPLRGVASTEVYANL